MKKTLLSLAFIANVACSQSFIRTHTIVSDNSTFPTPANVEWMQGESVRFEITAKSGNFYIPLSNGVAPVLKMWSGNVITQLYAQKTGTIYSAGSGKLYVDLLANEANISPSGAYNYAVGVYDGTQYMGVVAQGRATVRAHPFGTSVGYVGAFNAFPYVPTNDANYLGGITGAVAGAGVSIARTGRTVYISTTAGGGGSGTFTNLQWGTNNNTAQALIRAESNIVFRSANGTNYAALAGNLTGDFTFNGAINANDNIEIANGKHFRFQDGGGTNTVHLAATAGRLIITGAVDIVTGQAVPATINGAQVATASDVSARLASNVWAVSDSTTNYVRRTGDTMTGALQFPSIAGNVVYLSPTGLVFYSFDSENSVTLTRDYSGLGGVGLYRGSSKIWDAGIDGSGSGLDADLLDGLNSTAFFQSIATNGSGNVVTNLTFGGSVITQQMGTVTGGGGSTSTLYRVESQVNGVGFTTANGPTAVLTGAVTAVSAAPWVDTWEVANTITTQILSSANWSNVNFDTYAPDNPGRNYNITNDVLTFSSTGLCHVTAAARVFGMSSANRVQMMLYRNGSQFRQGIVLTATTNATPTISVSFYNHTATNTYTVAVIQEDAVAREIRGGGSTGAYLVWASGYRFRNAGE